ncbi:unnamed protein product [Pedinophyceae sp. YPF-701]|nr:unnamed protein product [Pedinophyceae sp. YPF-701]
MTGAQLPVEDPNRAAAPAGARAPNGAGHADTDEAFFLRNLPSAVRKQLNAKHAEVEANPALRAAQRLVWLRRRVDPTWIATALLGLGVFVAIKDDLLLADQRARERDTAAAALQEQRARFRAAWGRMTAVAQSIEDGVRGHEALEESEAVQRLRALYAGAVPSAGGSRGARMANDDAEGKGGSFVV